MDEINPPAQVWIVRNMRTQCNRCFPKFIPSMKPTLFTPQICFPPDPDCHFKRIGTRR